jgi:hypothetical protein
VPPPRFRIAVGVVLALTLAAGACNRGAAEESLEAAERTLEAARPELERYAPEELAALSQDLRDARADLEAGEYTRALRVAQGFPQRVRAAVAIAGRQRRALEATRDEVPRRGPASRAGEPPTDRS